MLEIENLRFAYSGEGPSFRYDITAGPGTVTTISGPSGSGKSTLFDLISGSATPHGGTIQLAGNSMLELPVARRPVSILFQSNNVFGHLSARDNVRLGAPRDLSGTEPAILSALETVGLAAYADQRVDRLSGGQQQRIALARTLLRNKPILLLDEPFASLDPELVGQMRLLIKKLTGENRWITLVISHLEGDTGEFADRSYEMRDGRLLPSG